MRKSVPLYTFAYEAFRRVIRNVKNFVKPVIFCLSHEHA